MRLSLPFLYDVNQRTRTGYQRKRDDLNFVDPSCRIYRELVSVHKTVTYNVTRVGFVDFNVFIGFRKPFKYFI